MFIGTIACSVINTVGIKYHDFFGKIFDYERLVYNFLVETSSLTQYYSHGKSKQKESSQKGAT